MGALADGTGNKTSVLLLMNSPSALHSLGNFQEPRCHAEKTQGKLILRSLVEDDYSTMNHPLLYQLIICENFEENLASLGL